MGRYRVVRKLAVGGMAEVLLAKVIGAGGFEKPVAVKRMLPSMAADPSFVDAFLREARLTVALQHPNIVQVHDFGAVKGHYYQVLEYVDGENLRQVLTALVAQGQKLSVAEACFIVQQVAEGLAYAHGVAGPDRKPLNIIHRDINPSNVMVSRIGEVKLADFGIAKAADGTQGTQVGVIKGKAGYLSPEQVRGTEVDQRSDIFLMGLLLHELIAGKRLFDAPNYFQALQRIATFDPRQLPPLPEVPAPLWAILVKLLEPDPAQRMASARALSDELQAFLFDARLRVGTKDMTALFARAFPGRASPLEAMSAPQAADEKSEEIQIDESDMVEPPKAPAPAAPSPANATSAVLGRVAVTSVPASEARPSPPPRPAAAVPSRATPPPQRAPTPAPIGKRRTVGEILLGQCKLTQAQLDDALKGNKDGRIGERLIVAGIVSALDVVRALAEQNGVPYIGDDKLKAAPVPEEAVKLLKEEVAAKYGAVPVQLRGKTLLCAMQDPLNHDALQAMKFAAGVIEVKGVYATEGAIRAARERFYRSSEGAGAEADAAAEDWRGKVPDYSPTGITPFSDRVTGSRETHFDEAEFERRMAAAESESAPPPPAPARATPAPSAGVTPPPFAAGFTAGVGPSLAQFTPAGGVMTRTEPTGSMRLAASAAIGGVRKVLIVSDRPDQLDLASRLLAGCGVQISLAASTGAEGQLNAGDPPELVVIAEDGVPQAAALSRQLAAKAPGVEIRVATLAAGVLGDGPAMGRVSALYAAALEALWAPGLPSSSGGLEHVPGAARLSRQVAGWLGGGRVEQERAAALLNTVAAANRISGRPLISMPVPSSLSTVTGGESAETMELFALWSPRPPAKARPAAQAVVAVVAFVERAGGVQVERAADVVERLAVEGALPTPSIEALRTLVVQGGDSGKDAVIVADSDSASAGILQQRLVGAGLKAILARTGAEARELLRQGARALVASTSLPDTEGPALVSAIRADNAATPPVLYLLAHDASEDVSAGLDAGADDVMVKPVNAEVIAAKLRRALGVKAVRAS